jgi:adenylate cyclase
MLPIWLRKTGVIRKLGFTLGAGITVTMVILSWLGPGFLVRLENTSLDFRFKLRGKRNVGSSIVLVAVDEKSLQELGRWPWSRERQARLLQTIAADG